MANIINATVGGIVSTGDSTATLDIQTGGVTAIGIGANQSLTISNAAITTLTATSASITTVTGTSATFTTSSDANGNLRNIPSAGAAKTSAYTLSISDIGEFVTVGSGGSITVPNDVFAAGNAVSIYNDTTGNISINCPITTAYAAGTNTDRASLTLSTRGVATVLFINPSLCVFTGNVS